MKNIKQVSVKVVVDCGLRYQVMSRLPSTPDASSINRALPIEVLEIVLSHLRYDSDKTTLAHCMRVSKAFKIIAAPLLYEKLEWKHLEKNALRLVEVGNAIETGRMNIVTKEVELRYIKSIELQNHSVTKCPLHDGPNAQIQLDLSTLRVLMNDNLMINNSERCCMGLEDCPLVKALAAKKLVIVTNGKHEAIRLNQDIDWQLEEYIVHLKLRSCEWEGPTLHLVNKAKRLVFILTNLVDVIPLSGYVNKNKWLRSRAEEIAMQLAYYSQLRHSPNEIVLVNFRDLNDRYIRTPNTSIRSFEDICQKELDDFVPSRWNLQPGTYWKTAAESALVSYKFVTLREYLTDYNWEGVYSEEEVAALLRALR